MATFIDFSNVLPDPIHRITPSGNLDSITGSPGPGFASVSLSSNKGTQVSRTNSGRGVTRESESHYWMINIRYNPMTRDEFDVIDSFLLARNSRLTPFYVVLPQYSKPRDQGFAVFSSVNTISVAGTYNSGSTFMMIDCPIIISGDPRPGDKFTITDPNDANHLKVYSITRVENNSLYQIGKTQPNIFQKRIWFNPPLQRLTTDNSVINFINPKFRVIMTNDVQESDLSVDGLYSFSLSLEELLP